uniref:Zinc knuckle CX2CX4HX4C domain-containing protein n=1 Tax=Cannabis sativa TaxID=3483 RepID=A0A803P0U8_CANSA
MDNFIPTMSSALSVREKEVINLSGLNTPPPRPIVHRLLCRIFSKRGYNPKQFKNFIISQWLGRFEVSISDYDSNTDSYTVSFGCEGDLRRVLSKEPWHFHNQHMILCPPSVLQNASMDSYTITPFWIQVYRLPFLSKSEALAKILGNMVGTFLEVHEDSLNEGWGPFLRMRVGIDVSKPLLRGQLVSFPWMANEMWLDYRYERLPDFYYECGIIGHVFDKCPSFLEKLDEGLHPDLPYGPWMEGSSLPKSSYDKYRQDFSKEGPWPFITRLARNTINPIINHPRLPATPVRVTNTEKGKGVMESTQIFETANKSFQHLQLISPPTSAGNFNTDLASSSGSRDIVIDKHDTQNTTNHTLQKSIPCTKSCNVVSQTKKVMDIHSTTFSPHSLPQEIPPVAPTPPIPIATYPPPTTPISNNFVPIPMNIPPAYLHITNSSSLMPQMSDAPAAMTVPVDSTLPTENRLSSFFNKRQLTTSGGNVCTILKRCCTRASPLADTTNFPMHQQPDPSSEFHSNSLKADGDDASLAKAAA